MRLFFSLFIFYFTLFASNTDVKIKETLKAIKSKKIETSNMNRRLDDLVKSLNRQKLVLSHIESEIESYNKEIKKLVKELSSKQNNLVLLNNKMKKLETEREKNQEAILDYFSHNYYLAHTEAVDLDNLINEEVVKKVTSITQKRVAELSKKYIVLSKNISELYKKIVDLKQKKLSLNEKRKELLKLKNSYNQEVELLSKQIKNYKETLDKIINQKRQFQEQLAKLKLLKQKEIQKKREEERRARLEAERKKRLLEEKKRKEKLSKKEQQELNSLKVKKYGSSYMKTKTKKYRGKKTISPVKNGKIVSKFGSYIDPIYKIQIYNDSIKIEAPKNSKVRAIFDGKVVYIGKSSNRKMIVIQHRNRLYSIYANLSKVSPFIKKGYRVKKGEIIGRIEKELTFEITYKDVAINPLDVINFR